MQNKWGCMLIFICKILHQIVAKWMNYLDWWVEGLMVWFDYLVLLIIVKPKVKMHLTYWKSLIYIAFWNKKNLMQIKDPLIPILSCHHLKYKFLKMFSSISHCSFDVRGRAFSKALYWSDTNAFGPRAYFLTVSKPATLSVDNVQLDDEGVSSPICKFSFIFLCMVISTIHGFLCVFSNP